MYSDGFCGGIVFGRNWYKVVLYIKCRKYKYDIIYRKVLKICMYKYRVGRFVFFYDCYNVV